MSKTNIFVSVNKERTRQIVIYANNVENDKKNNAMILPVPNPQSLKFHDLSDYKDFFDDCEDCFTYKTNSYTNSLDFMPITNSLEVFQVGSYNISVALNLSELTNIDKSVFDVDNKCLTLLRNCYGDTNYGFIICKLQTGTHDYHPLGYSHNVGDKILIPTKHYHGNLNEQYADDWDHKIYVRNIPEHDLFKFTHNISGLQSKGYEWNKRDINTNDIDFDFGTAYKFSRAVIEGSRENSDIYLPISEYRENLYIRDRKKLYFTPRVGMN